MWWNHVEPKGSLRQKPHPDPIPVLRNHILPDDVDEVSGGASRDAVRASAWCCKWIFTTSDWGAKWVRCG